jgi:hypothetical protein
MYFQINFKNFFLAFSYKLKNNQNINNKIHEKIEYSNIQTIAFTINLYLRLFLHLMFVRNQLRIKIGEDSESSRHLVPKDILDNAKKQSSISNPLLQIKEHAQRFY